MKRKTKKIAPIAFRHAFLIVILLFARSAFAWGPEGHDVVVRMALRIMKQDERKAVYALLGTDDPHRIGNWADSIKQYNGTGPWHYVDIPGYAEHYKAERDCPDANCIIAKLQMVQLQIRNHSLSRQRRKEALLYWFHLVGDLYQPFHCYGDKRGANDITVYFHGKETNLHKLWDNEIIFYKNPSARSLASDIFNGSHRVPSPNTTFVDAAEKSHARAIDMKLKNNATVDSKYVDQAWKMMNTCLWEAACMAATIGPDV